MVQELFSLYLKKRGASAARMFGSPGVMISGNVMMFEWKNTLVLRLGEKDAAQAVKIRGAAFFSPMEGGKGSKGWVAVPTESLNSSIIPFTDAAFRFAAALPPKDVKPGTQKSTVKTKARKATAKPKPVTRKKSAPTKGKVVKAGSKTAVKKKAVKKKAVKKKSSKK